MKLIGIAIALLAVAVLSAPTVAQCTVRRQAYQQTYVAQTYAAPAYVAPAYQQTYAANYATQILAVPVIVPGYGVGYGAGTNYLAADDVTNLKRDFDTLKRHNEFLLQLLQGSQQLLKTPQAKPPMQDLPQSKAPAGGHPGLAVATQRCGKCHDSLTKAKGGGIALLASGQRAPVSGDVFKALTKAVMRNTMPPASEGPKLTDEEATAVLDLYLQ